MLEKSLDRPLNSKEIKPVNLKDSNLDIHGRIDVEAETPVFWPPDIKSWLIEKDPDSWKDWRQKEIGVVES